MIGFVVLIGSFWYLFMVLMVLVLSIFVFGGIVVRNKLMILIVSRKSILYKFFILILGKYLYFEVDF